MMLLEALQQPFMIRALVVGILIAASSAFLGSFLVLKRYSMIGHGLSHVAFAAVAISLVLGTSPLILTLSIVILSSVLILRVNQKSSVFGEASIGLAATFAMALGTVLASIRGGFKVELYSYLFGSILTIQRVDMILSIVASFLIFGYLLFHYRDLLSLTFDEEFAHVQGIKTQRLNIMLAIFSGLIISLGIRAIGSILISSFILFPTMIAIQFQMTFRKTILWSIIIAILLVWLGLLGSYVLDWPSGSTIVLLSGLIYSIVLMTQRMRKGRES